MKPMTLTAWLWRAVLAAGVAGCAYTPPAPFVVVGNGKSVSINWENSTLGPDGALNAAEKHCARFGLGAELSAQVSRFEVIYRCV
jgi:hypothetical protein